MDIKATAEKLISKITSDKDLLKKFKANPKDTIKSLISEELSQDQLENIVSAVKAKVSVDDAKDVLGKVKGIFGK